MAPSSNSEPLAAVVDVPMPGCFTDMDVAQQAQAMQIALCDPMGWTSTQLPAPSSSVSLQIFSHPSGVCLHMCRNTQSVRLYLRDMAKLVWHMDLDTQDLSPKILYEDSTVFLDIQAHQLGIKLGALQTFGLSTFQYLLLGNFSPEARASMENVRMLLAGYLLTQDSTAQGSARLTQSNGALQLLLNGSLFWPKKGSARAQLDRMGRSLLHQAGIGRYRMHLTAFPFSVAMASCVMLDLPTSAHARAEVIRAYAAWRCANPARTLSAHDAPK